MRDGDQACPACGGRETVVRTGVRACAFCGAELGRMLLPGSLCGDRTVAGVACTQLAQTLCWGCACPLCDRHNDPALLYWSEPLHWRRLVPRWSEQDGTAWALLIQPAQHLPIEGFAPFPWVPHDRNALLAVGLLEVEILDAVRAAVAPAGGDPDENAVRFESVCNACQAEAAKRIEEATGRFAPRYRTAAYAARLEAMRADCEQGVRYVEAFLRRPLPTQPPAPGPPVAGLGLDSDPLDWQRLGHDLKQNEVIARRLAAALQGS